MNPVSSGNPVASLLDKAFDKFDRNKDGKLDASEYQSLYEVLRAGIAVDENGKSVIGEKEYFDRMDQNGDGGVSRAEMENTPVIMPAALTGDSLEAMIEFLQAQATENAALAAQYLSAPDPQSEEAESAEIKPA